MTGRIGPTSPQLQVPTQPPTPLKTVMPKTVETEPKIERSRSMTMVSEPQMLESQVSKTSSKSMSVTKEILGTKVLLSDLSGELTAQQKLKGAFKGLKDMFTISSNTLQFNEKGSISTSLKDLFLMKYNPLASSKDKAISSSFDMFTYKEWSNENVEFLKFSRKLVKMGVDHPDFDKHIGTAIKHFVRPGSIAEINVSSQDRVALLASYDAYAKDPSVENKAKLVKEYASNVERVYGVLRLDTLSRFQFEGESLRQNIGETKQGRLWNNFKTAHKTWWNNRRPWNTMNDVKQDFSNFFKSWGAFSKVAVNPFLLNATPEEGVSTKKVTIGGKKHKITGSSSTVMADKEAMMKYRAFRDGITAPKYSDYGFE